MNRNLTQRSLAQLGESDPVQRAMESNDFGMLTPRPADVKPDLPDAGRDQSAVKPGLPDGQMHADREHGRPEPLPYVWTM